MLYALVVTCQMNMCQPPSGFDDLIFVEKDRCEAMATALNQEKPVAGVVFSCSDVEAFHANRDLPILPETSPVWSSLTMWPDKAGPPIVCLYGDSTHDFYVQGFRPAECPPDFDHEKREHQSQ